MTTTLVCKTKFPVSALVHAIDNLTFFDDEINLVFPNFNNEGQTLYCDVSAIKISDNVGYYQDNNGQPTEFFEISDDAILKD